MRWLAPPPSSTAHLSSRRSPGTVLRVSRMLRMGGAGWGGAGGKGARVSGRRRRSELSVRPPGALLHGRAAPTPHRVGAPSMAATIAAVAVAMPDMRCRRCVCVGGGLAGLSVRSCSCAAAAELMARQARDGKRGRQAAPRAHLHEVERDALRHQDAACRAAHDAKLLAALHGVPVCGQRGGRGGGGGEGPFGCGRPAAAAVHATGAVGTVPAAAAGANSQLGLLRPAHRAWSRSP
jgi:hypothetical protein